MKKSTLTSFLSILGCAFLLPLHAEEHLHDGKPCTGHDEANATETHDHLHDNEDAAHTHEASTTSEAHEHDGKPCSGNHDAKSPDHNGESDTHEHSEGDGHNHANESEQHEHANESAEHKHTDADGHDHGAAPCPSTLGTPLTISPKAQKALALKYYTVHDKQALPDNILVGKLILPPSAIESYSLPLGGKVNIAVKMAQNVETGSLLYSVESPELVTLINTVNDAKAQCDRNAMELQNLEARRAQLAALNTKNSELESSISFKKAEYLTLKSAYDSAKALLDQACSGGELQGKTLLVKAQQPGRVESIQLTQGEWANQGTSILSMAKNHGLEFNGNIYAGTNMQDAEAQLLLTHGDSSELIPGELRVGAQVNPTTQLRSIYFSPKELPKTAYAGQVCELHIHLKGSKNNDTTPVPNGAVVRNGIDHVVFIKDPNCSETFYMKTVEPEPARQGWTPVKGLKNGDKIVTLGGNELKYAIPTSGGKKESAAGHFHADGKFHTGEH